MQIFGRDLQERGRSELQVSSTASVLRQVAHRAKTGRYTHAVKGYRAWRGGRAGRPGWSQQRFDSAAGDMDHARSEYAKSVEAARRNAAMSQAKLAEHMVERGFSFHVTTIGKIERGERRLALDEAIALAASLHISLDALTGDRIDRWRDAYKTGYEDALSDLQTVVGRLRP